MRILLVEDSIALRCLFAQILKIHGFEVCEATDGLAAIACLSHFRPEVILTDLMMPNLDGMGFIQRLKEIPHLEAVPVVVMTAVPTHEAVRAAHQAGAAQVLAKPLDSTTLLACLKNYRHMDGSQAPPRGDDADHFTPEADGR